MRRAKTEAKVSQRAAVDTLLIRSGDAARAAIDAALADLRDAGSIDTVVFEPGDQVECTVTLAPPAD